MGENFSVKFLIFSNLLVLAYVLGAQKNRLIETFGCSKEPSHRDGSFEYPQHMFWLRNKKIIFSSPEPKAHGNDINGLASPICHSA